VERGGVYIEAGGSLLHWSGFGSGLGRGRGFPKLRCNHVDEMAITSELQSLSQLVELLAAVEAGRLVKILAFRGQVVQAPQDQNAGVRIETS